MRPQTVLCSLALLLALASPAHAIPLGAFSCIPTHSAGDCTIGENGLSGELIATGVIGVAELSITMDNMIAPATFAPAVGDEVFCESTDITGISFVTLGSQNFDMSMTSEEGNSEE